MLLTWMAYATLFGALTVAAARALEAIALRRGIPTRFIWLFALLVAVAAPPLVGLRAPRYTPSTKREAGPLTPATATSTPAAKPAARPVTPHFRVRALVFLLKIDPYLGRFWLAASLVYAVILLRAAIAIHRRRRRWQTAEIDGESVLISTDVGPAVVGVLRPRIVLPQWALSMEEPARALMLRHEREHIRSRDPVLLTTAIIVSAVFPWNAAVWAILRRMRLTIEIDCDRRVARTLAVAREYGELLLAVGSRPRTPSLFVASLAERHGLLEQRIKAMTPSVSRHPRVFTAALILVALAVSTAAVRAPRPGPFIHRAAAGPDSLSLDELRALLLSHQPEALVASSGINTVTVLLDANGNYVTSLAETRAVTGGGRGGRGGGGAERLVLAGELSNGPAGGVALSNGRRDSSGGRARGNIRDGVPGGVATGVPGGVADERIPASAHPTKSTEMRRINPLTGEPETSVHVASLSMINGDTVLLAIRESSGSTGFVKHVYITLDGPIGAAEIFGFNENVLGNLVSAQQVQSVHAHAYAAGELADHRLNVFVVRLKP